ncbi:MAG: prenyltransferase/squalene oxidase repeat-containing protein, partial [Promethearchaeota archaeon]
MYFKRYLILICLAMFLGMVLICQVSIYINNIDYTSPQKNANYGNFLDHNLLNEMPQLSTDENYENLEAIFDTKINNIDSLGYFPQIYESSLQATYYGIYILDALGKLDDIDQITIVNYIMDHYNSSSHIFMDDYSYRYLTTDPDISIYSYASLLEINCYAILSLNLLGNLELIEMQDSIDFIWSCYNPITSGFIGQSYSVGLSDYFKLSTMDNTYYAIITLDILMNNWNDYSIEKDALVAYINDLQETAEYKLYFGGFHNDADSNIDTLEMIDQNILASYYCVKSMEVFNLENTIRINDFYTSLDALYNETSYFFSFYYYVGMENYSNIVASALGLELSDLTGYSSINRNELINFIINNRNEYGNWDSSTTYKYHELIDTFQIV